MGKVKKGTLLLAKKVAELEVDMKKLGWPPDCLGLLYQPRRPQIREVVVSVDEKYRLIGRRGVKY